MGFRKEEVCGYIWARQVISNKSSLTTDVLRRIYFEMELQTLMCFPNEGILPHHLYSGAPIGTQNDPRRCRPATLCLSGSADKD
ncbi:hypothetical protein Plhal304r1_c078g0165031 [Plasmopara halstedii]